VRHALRLVVRAEWALGTGNAAKTPSSIPNSASSPGLTRTTAAGAAGAAGIGGGANLIPTAISRVRRLIAHDPKTSNGNQGLTMALMRGNSSGGASNGHGMTLEVLAIIMP
jgi:hypothetical protein